VGATQVNGKGYDLFENNCEHFATYCKTGTATSHQVNGARNACEAYREITDEVRKHNRWAAVAVEVMLAPLALANAFIYMYINNILEYIKDHREQLRQNPASFLVELEGFINDLTKRQ
jgi:Lecithin retinol acyltransferase